MTDSYSLLDRGTGLVRLMSEQCSTCVGRPGNLMDLRPGRLKDLINQNIRGDSMGLTCHQTLSYGDNPDYGEALCRWFYDTYGGQCNGIRVIERLGGFTEVPRHPRRTMAEKNIIDELMAEVKEEIEDGATAQSLKQRLRQMFERAYKAGQDDARLDAG